MANFDPTAFANTPDADARAQAPDPGTYEIVLDDAKAFQSKAGVDIVILTMRVASGPSAGHVWDELRSFRDDNAYKATKATCQRLGMNLDGIASLDDFDNRLKLLIGNWYAVDVVQKGEYRNVYVKDGGPLGGSDFTSPDAGEQFEPAAAPAGSDGDVPF